MEMPELLLMLLLIFFSYQLLLMIYYLTKNEEGVTHLMTGESTGEFKIGVISVQKDDSVTFYHRCSTNGSMHITDKFQKVGLCRTVQLRL